MLQLGQRIQAVAHALGAQLWRFLPQYRHELGHYCRRITRFDGPPGQLLKRHQCRRNVDVVEGMPVRCHQPAESLQALAICDHSVELLWVGRLQTGERCHQGSSWTARPDGPLDQPLETRKGSRNVDVVEGMPMWCHHPAKGPQVLAACEQPGVEPLHRAWEKSL